MATKKCWRKAFGERGLRVYIFEREPGGVLYREVYVRGQRVGAKKSLRHRDKDRAVSYAFTLLAKLKTNEDALERGKLTLDALFDMFIASPNYRAKKPRTQREDESKLRRIIGFVGGSRDLSTLSYSDIERFREARQRGQCGMGKVGARAVAADVIALMTMLNWATREKNPGGKFLLDVNPLRGIKVATEKNPRQPVETYDRYLKLAAVAESVDWRLPLALALAEATGQRISSILKLRRNDVDFSRGDEVWIRFAGENQKTGFAHAVPLTAHVASVLQAHLERTDSAVNALLFASDRGDTAINRRTMHDYMQRAYKLAGLQPLDGGVWHPWRRKWATERKDMPLKDVAAAGGWRDYQTLLKSYQQVDSVTLSRVVLDAPKLMDRGMSAA